MNNPKMKAIQENWKKSGIPESAGRMGSAPSSASMNDKFANIRNGQMKGEIQKFTQYNTNRKGSQGSSMPQGAASFNAIPEAKVGKDRRPLDPKNRVEVTNFSAPKTSGNSELDAISDLFAGGGSSRNLESYSNQNQGGYNQVPQMNYNQNSDIDLNQMYAQKGDNYDPRQMIAQHQQRNPQQQELNYNSQGQQNQNQNGYNPNMNMEQQMMNNQYGQQYQQSQQQRQEGEYMQYAQNNNSDQRSQMESIARDMTLQVLSEYKKQEKKNSILSKVRHRKFDNLVKDQNNQHYLMEFDRSNYMTLKPVKMTKKD